MTNGRIFPPHPPQEAESREGSRTRVTCGGVSGRWRRLRATFRAIAWVLFSQCLPLCEGAQPTTLTWTGAAGDNSVSNRLNWSPSQVPVAGDTLIFDGAAGLTPQLAANLTVAGLSFGSTAQAFVLGGAGIFTIGSGGIANGSTAGKTINNSLVLSASQTWNAASGSLLFGGAVNLQSNPLTTSGAQAITITGVISGSGALTHNGPGTLQFGGTAANTFTGITTVKGGELDLNKPAGVLAVAGNLTIGDGVGGANSDIVKLLAAGQIAATSTVLVHGSSGKLDLNGFDQTLGSLADTGTVAAGGSSVNLGAGTLTVGNTSSTIFSGTITGTGGLVKQGAGTLTLGGANVWTGLTTITEGTLQLGAAAAFPASGNLTIFGGTFDIRGQSPTVGSVIFGNGTGTAAAAISDSASVKGTVTLTGGIAFNGTAGFTFPPAQISTKIQLSPGIHSITNPNGIYSAAVAYDVIFGGVVSGTGGISKDGPSADFWIALNAANTYTGVTNVTTGNLYLGVANAVPQFSAVTVDPTGILNLNPPVTQYGLSAGSYSQSIGSLAGGGSVTLGSATLTTGNDGTSTAFSGVISGTGGFAKVGAGTQTLSGANTFTGTTVISGGIVNVTGALVTSAVTVNGGGALGGSGDGTATGIIGGPAKTSGGIVTVAGGATAATRGAIDLTDGAIGIFTIGGNSTGAGTVTLTLGGAAGAGSVLKFDMSATGTDRLVVLQKVQVNAGGVSIGLNPLSGTVLAAGTYPLITYASDILTGTYTLGYPASYAGNNYALVHTATAENLVVTTVPVPAVAFWNGAQGTQWNSFAPATNVSNWATTAAGTANANQIPGAISDVFFSVASGATNLANTLGANFSVKSLTFTAGSASATLGGANTLTIGTGGITNASAAAQTLGTNIALGAAQTWTNNGGLLTLGGASISGAGLNLTTAGTGNFAISAALQTGAGSFIHTGSGTVTLTGANAFTGTTTISGGTLVAGNNIALGSGTQAVIFNGGALASNSDTRTLANPITVNPVAGNSITGSSSVTLSGAVGGTGRLTVNLASNAKTVTVNPAAANSFAPGMVRLNSGTLLLGGSDKMGDTTGIEFAGGALNTGGFSDQLGALVLAASSTLDFGTSNNSHLQFSSATWSGGTLSILNWTGNAFTSGNADQFLVTSSGPVDSGFLNQISFQGYQTGAIAFDRGAGLYEIVPVPEPTTIFGASALVAFVFWRERRRIGRVFRNGGSRRQDR